MKGGLKFIDIERDNKKCGETGRCMIKVEICA